MSKASSGCRTNSKLLMFDGLALDVPDFPDLPRKLRPAGPILTLIPSAPVRMLFLAL